MRTINFYGRIIGKIAEKEPQIVVKDVNGKKHKIPIQSGMDLETDFAIGEELKISYSVIPHEILVQRQHAQAEVLAAQEEEPSEASPEVLKPTSTTVLCLLGVPDDLRGKDAVCQGCPSLKERLTESGPEAYCELSAIAAEVAQVSTQPTELEQPPETAPVADSS